MIWWLASLAADALPGPGVTAAALADMAADGRLVSIVWRLAAFMGACFAIAVVLGVAGGLAIGMSRAGDRGLSPYLAALQGMPTSMWIPVAAIVLGTDVWSLGAVVTLGAVPAIMLGTRTAVRNVPPLLLRAGRTLGESGTSLVKRVVLPAALPGIMTGVELGWSIAFRCLVAGEIFSGALSGTGIGTVISRSRQTGDLTEMMATIIIVLAFTVLIDRLVFSRVQSRLRTRRGLVDAGLPH
ncbi:ABC transporter permease subunit [Demequina sp.]|uniref:ABC transporter permease n=1 Tax=Demequina sp. TaxID=2050685 RepID=UPI0025BA8AAA|nr:ABC transporter permease subunit [Demequina sp.]